jgi:hypothetical protein
VRVIGGGERGEGEVCGVEMLAFMQNKDGVAGAGAGDGVAGGVGVFDVASEMKIKKGGVDAGDVEGGGFAQGASGLAQEGAVVVPGVVLGAGNFGEGKEQGEGERDAQARGKAAPVENVAEQQAGRGEQEEGVVALFGLDDAEQEEGCEKPDVREGETGGAGGFTAEGGQEEEKSWQQHQGAGVEIVVPWVGVGTVDKGVAEFAGQGVAGDGIEEEKEQPGEGGEEGEEEGEEECRVTSDE